jgi:hypothetical protein
MAVADDGLTIQSIKPQTPEKKLWHLQMDSDGPFLAQTF